MCRPFGDVWVFNTDSLEWKRFDIGGAAPAPREMASGTMLDQSRMLIFGGRSASGAVLSDSAVLDMTSMSWKQAKDHVGFGRCTHSAVLLAALQPKNMVRSTRQGSFVSQICFVFRAMTVLAYRPQGVAVWKISKQTTPLPFLAVSTAQPLSMMWCAPTTVSFRLTIRSSGLHAACQGVCTGLGCAQAFGGT